MNDLQIFIYSGAQLRTIQQPDGLWWVLRDVCEVLGLSTPARVAERLDDDEKGVSLIHTPGGKQEMTIINEPGLYSVILRSDKPEAKAFKRWVVHEVLPSIRKTGSYTVSEQTLKNLACLKKLQEQLNTHKDLEAKFSELAADALKNYREWREERDRLRTQAANIQHQIDTLICWMEIPQGHNERSLK